MSKKAQPAVAELGDALEATKRTNVDVHTFIKGYVQATTWEEASKLLDMPIGSIRQRVNYLRKKGVNLQNKNSGGRGRALNVNELNEYITQLTT